MSKLLIVALFGLMFATVGCKNKDEETMTGTSSASESTMSAGADACSHCAGVQTAKADGTCSACGGKVK
ncbi:MAG: hypothetical protein WBD40_20620 [Tepidisphaeraceae bacterium]